MDAPNFQTPPTPGLNQGNPIAQIHTDLVRLTTAINAVTQQIAASFPTFVTPPVTTTSVGIAGQFAYDANYLYVAYGTNSWGRLALDKAF